MKRDDLNRLLHLRRERERKAMTIVAARQNLLRRAEEQLASASQAVADQERQSRDQERQKLAGLIGQELRVGQLATLQSSLNAQADRHRHLTGLVRNAEKARQDRRAELEIALTEFRKRHRQAEKLALLRAELKVKADRRELAIAEAATDELHGAKPDHETPPISGDA